MNIKTCIVLCVLIIGIVSLILVPVIVVKFSDRIDDLTKAISQPGITSTVTIDEVVITTPDDVKFEVRDFDAELNSRLLDMVITALVNSDKR